MKLQSKVFRSHGTWDSLCEEVTTWVNDNVTRERLASISVSEPGSWEFDTNGTIIVWYWE